MTGDSISSRAGQLRSAADAVPSRAVVELSDALAAIRDQLVSILEGAAYGEEAILTAAVLVEEADGLCRQLVDLRNMLNAAADRQQGTSGGQSAAGGASGQAPTPQAPPPVTAPDGSQYPTEAAWVADIMPPRVREGTPGEKTIGYADGEIGLKFTSGIDQTYSPAIERRLRALGERPDVARRLRSHVELKAAERMLQAERTHSEVVINNVPCGSQPRQDYRGCHDTLSRFLPTGSTLTVHGTTQAGKPYSYTYRGTA